MPVPGLIEITHLFENELQNCFCKNNCQNNLLSCLSWVSMKMNYRVGRGVGAKKKLGRSPINIFLGKFIIRNKIEYYSVSSPDTHTED